MKKNKKWETLIWALVSLTIFVLIALSIVTIIDLKNQNDNLNIKNLEEKILKENLKNIFENANLNNFSENEIFFLDYSWENINFSRDDSFENKNFFLENEQNWKYKISFKKNKNIEWIDILPEINIKSNK